MNTSSKSRTELSPASKRSRKAHGKVHKKKSVGARAKADHASAQAITLVTTIKHSPARKTKSTISSTTNAPDISVADWPENPHELRQLISEPVHPAADRLPLWPREKLIAAAQALQTMGQQIDPVQRLRDTGQIIDGRNTRLICLIAGMEPYFVDIDLPPTMSADEYVEFRNVVRRQLPLEQLAVVAAKRYISMREEGKQRRRENLRKGARRPEVEKIPNRKPANSLNFLSNLFSVNAKYIQDATAILDHDPELFEKVAAGKVKFSDARAQMGLVQHRVRKPVREPSASLAVENNHPHEASLPVASRAIDNNETLATLLKDILRIRSTPKEKREPALERLIRKALKAQQQLQGSLDTAA